MRYFRHYTRQDLLNVTRLRRYETKLGEKIRVHEGGGNLAGALQASPARFVLFGIPEDVGVRANHGVGGADTAWTPFLKAFLNLQSCDRFTGDELLLLGQFDFSHIEQIIDANAKSYEEQVDALRHAVSNIIDGEVEELAKIITAAGKIPIAIGGGHNNAYPLIKGSAKGLQKAGKIDKTKISVVNVDAHADYRISEGRHSGNAFRYAMEEDYLRKYAVVGLHEIYNAQSMMDDLYSNVNIHYSSFEDIFIQERLNFRQAVAQAFGFTDDDHTGVELDLDAVRDVLSSATSPVGISPIHARQYMSFAGAIQRPAYLHICEGAVKLDDGRTDEKTGKLIAYLVTDYVKSALG